MKIEIMNESHRDKVLELSKAFYCSDALDHEVPMNIIETNIDAAISGDKGLIGFVFCEDNEVVGFSYVTTYYETEVGGICVQIIDLYVNENARGKGVATQYFNYLFDKYSDAKRFRLEVVKDNVKAVSLYKKMGFTDVTYGQMKIDKI